MAAELVPVRLGITAGDLYPCGRPLARLRRRVGGVPRRDEDLFRLRIGRRPRRLRPHRQRQRPDRSSGLGPAQTANAHARATEKRQADLIAVEELLAESPPRESIAQLANTLAVVSSIGTVCELPARSPASTATQPGPGGRRHGAVRRPGRAEAWNGIAEIVARSWDDVIAAIDEVVTTPSRQAGRQAGAEEPRAAVRGRRRGRFGRPGRDRRGRG